MFAVTAVSITVLIGIAAAARGSVISVDTNVQGDDPNCWNGSISCKSLNFALKYAQENNFTTIVLASEEHILSEGATFVWTENFTLMGRDPVLITCMHGAGFAFLNSKGITIKNIQFSNCGQLQVSTSRNFGSISLDYLKFFTAFYFLFCKDVSFSYVAITDSHGIGVQVYATVGEVRFEHCKFLHNSINTTDIAGGGGLYIEFPYCAPEDYNCGTGPSNVSRDYSENAAYTINNCTFQNNIARVNEVSNITFVSFIPQGTDHWAFGRGGGLSVFFKGNARSNSIFVNNSTVIGNEALWGGGIFAEFQDFSENNILHVHSTIVERNRCYSDRSFNEGTGGGGVRLGIIFYNLTSEGYSYAHNNHFHFENCSIVANDAYWGGGASFYAARETQSVTPTNTLKFVNCEWRFNTARLGSAVNLAVWHAVLRGAELEAKFTNCSFEKNNVTYIADLGGVVGVGTFFTDSIPVQFSGYIEFENNTQSALVATSTSLDFLENCNASFINNAARNGGAIQLHGHAFVRVHNNAQMTFVNNSALYDGGAIFSRSVGEQEIVAAGNCFIRFSDIDATPWEWTAKFYFRGNTANGQKNSIYATSVQPCLLGGSYGPSGDSNGTGVGQIFCWTENWDYEQSDCSNEISSAPASFTVSGMCYSMSAFPGRVTEAPIRVLDDFGRPITEPQVFGLQGESTNALADSTYVSDGKIKVFGSPNSSHVFSIETADPRILYTELTVELLPCPPGFIQTDDQHNRSVCVCGRGYTGLVRCTNNEAELQNGGWMGVTDHGVVVAGNHPYSLGSLFIVFSPLSNLTTELDSSICGPKHRTGTLCGRCVDGYAPAYNPFFECVKCSDHEESYHWVFYILSEFLPLTIFLLIMLAFRISVTNGPANAFVFFAQVVAAAINLGGQNFRSVPLWEIRNAYDFFRLVYVSIYGIANLNFFEPLLPKICLSQNLDALQLILLSGYTVAVYPLLFLLLIYTMTWLYNKGFKPIVGLCRPVHRRFAITLRKWSPESSLLYCFTTFIILSYSKFLFASFFYLLPAPLYDNQGHQVGDGRLYFNGDVIFLSLQHIPYFIVALFILAIFVTFLPLLLLVYPLKAVEKLSKCCSADGWKPGPKLLQLLDTFQGCYKDNHRYFAGLYLIFRIALVIIFITTTPNWFLQFLLQQLVFMTAILLFAIIRPYKVDTYNNIDTAIFINLAAINTFTFYGSYQSTYIVGMHQEWPIVLCYILIYCPLVCMVSYVVYTKLLMRSRRFSTFLESIRERIRSRSILTAHADSTADQDNDIDLAQLSIRVHENIQYSAYMQ